MGFSGPLENSADELSQSLVRPNGTNYVCEATSTSSFKPRLKIYLLKILYS